jgi:hypothetical protein
MGPAGVAKIVVAGSIPVVHVRPAFIVVAQPMLLEPPSKKRPVWNVVTTVFPQPNESGSSCVRCWLDWFVYGSELIGVATTLPAYTVAARANTPTSTTRATDASLLRFPLPTSNLIVRLSGVFG